VASLASLPVANPGAKRRCFAQFLPGGSASCPGPEQVDFRRAVLRMLCEDAAPAVGTALLERHLSAVEDFFRADVEGRAPLWFGHFSMEGTRGFKHGAKALATYAMAHRDSAWSLLRWGGRHAQAPAAVAARPHYFCELDVPATVASLLRSCPGFWRSREMEESVAGGELLGIDPGYWEEILGGWLEERSGRSDMLFDVVCDFLEGAAWARLCQRLLPWLPAEELLRFAGGIVEEAEVDCGMPEPSTWVQPAAWLAFNIEWPDLDSLLMVAACACSSVQLMRFIEEEGEEEAAEVSAAVQGLMDAEAVPAVHWAVRRAVLGERQPTSLAAFFSLRLFVANWTLRRLVKEGGEEALRAVLQSSGIECSFEGCVGSNRKRRKSYKHKRRRRERGSDASGGSDADESGGYGCGEVWRLPGAGEDVGGRALSTLEVLDFVLGLAAPRAWVEWVAQKNK
jgi:hypothetical protein